MVEENPGQRVSEVGRAEQRLNHNNSVVTWIHHQDPNEGEREGGRERKRERERERERYQIRAVHR